MLRSYVSRWPSRLGPNSKGGYRRQTTLPGSPTLALRTLRILLFGHHDHFKGVLFEDTETSELPVQPETQNEVSRRSPNDEVSLADEIPSQCRPAPGDVAKSLGGRLHAGVDACVPDLSKKD